MTNAKTGAVPEILNPEPVPVPELRPFHRKKLLGWKGKVGVDKIQGWVSNKRIDLFVRDYAQKYQREPTNVEVYDFMRSDEKEYRLRALAKDIGQHGVQNPIILDSDGTLLDGNRRYFATRLAIDDRLGVADDLTDIPAWVLTPDATHAEKEKVIIATNFLPSLKVPWPDYIKARVMFDVWENGADFKDIADQFGIARSRVKAMVKAYELIEEFISHFHRDDDPAEGEEAQLVASKNFVQFEEAQNKLRGQLDSDIDFKEHFFKWMFEGKFKSVTQIRRLNDVRSDQEAWDAIRQDSADAVGRAMLVLDEKKLGDGVDGERKVKRVIKTLKGLKEEEIASISKQALEDLRAVLTDVINMARVVNVKRMGTGTEVTDDI